jgi:phosphoribosylanthranilate isomerase
VFKIKICGVRRAEDLPHIAAAGADAIGLNFYAQSKRYLTPDAAATVALAVPKGVARVGVFVNSPTAEILAAAEQYGLDYLQLHGDEPPEQIAELRAWPVVRAFRFGVEGWRPVEEYLIACKRNGALPVALLIDAPGSEVSYGGGGATADWQALADWRAHVDFPLVLAGGLTPGNIAEAIRTVCPAAVDTATGVESSDGYKDLGKTRAFVATALAELG